MLAILRGMTASYRHPDPPIQAVAERLDPDDPLPKP
jgi:hypothetical protein